MSRERVLEVLEALGEAGWRLSVEDRDAKGRPRLGLSDDELHWDIERDDGRREVLVFVAFEGLGRRTQDLRDVCFCEARETGERLEFEARGSAAWREGLAAFVGRLGVARGA